MDWPLPPDDFEDTVLPDVAQALSHALAACGRVAFRCDDPPPGTDTIPPRPSPLTRVRDKVLGWAGLQDGPFTIAIASDPVAIAALFDYGGWSLGWQAALAFDPTADPAPIFGALQRGLDWQKRNLPPGARLLFGPGHDGAFAVVAAADATWLARFKCCVQEHQAPGE